MKILILCDHYPVSPRVIKIINSLKNNTPSTNIKVLAWNRGNFVESTDENTIIFNTPIGYGNPMKKLTNLKKFYRKFKEVTIDYKPDYIHGIDLEMFLLASRLYKNKALVYEVYDIKFFRNKMLNYLRERIEVFSLKRKKPSIIFASPFFEEYYKKHLNFNDFNYITINNKPSVNFITESNNISISTKNELINNKVIGFIGTVRYGNLLINLIDAMSNIKGIKFLIAGDGPDLVRIQNYVLEKNMNRQVIFSGRYTVDQLKEIYDMCDYVWAAYPPDDLNVKYAISNKFFESTLFNKPIIVSSGTYLGEMVNNEKLGVVVNPYDVSDIQSKINLIIKEEYIVDDKVSNDIIGLKYWEDEEVSLTKIYTY